jgi:succinyl-CoA synthetase beta subunit
MCGKNLVSPGCSKDANGLLCQSVLIMEKLSIDKEFFISIDYDTKHSCPVITYSNRGGVTLSRIRSTYPESIFKIYVDVIKGLDLATLLNVAKNLGIAE